MRLQLGGAGPPALLEDEEDEGAALRRRGGLVAEDEGGAAADVFWREEGVRGLGCRRLLVGVLAEAADGCWCRGGQ